VSVYGFQCSCLIPVLVRSLRAVLRRSSDQKLQHSSLASIQTTYNVPTMTALDCQELRSAFHGQIFEAADAGYETARMIWNASVCKRPRVIARCLGLVDVTEAIRFGRENNLLTAIRGGGHNVGGRALCEDGLVIDLSAMRGVHVDPVRSTVRVQGGVTLGLMDRETHVFGLAVPSGIVPKTGIAGLTLGGGVGWLVRKYGMTIDNLLACQIVTSDGRSLTASESEHPDLFWALRGGGGNFGVVTWFEFQGRPVRTVLGGMLVYPRSAAFDVIRHWRDFMEVAPDELTAYAGLLHGPDGSSIVGVIACYCGDLKQGERVLEPLRRFGNPLLDAIQPLPYPVMQSMMAPAFPDGNQNYWKSTLVKSLPDDAIATIVELGNQMQSPLSFLVIEQYGGAAARVPKDATAYPHRDLLWDVIFGAQWTDPEIGTHRDWARQSEKALMPYSANAHLSSALDLESDDVIDTAFGANLARLREIKQRYDPDNFFRVNYNIKPACQSSNFRPSSVV
jgi:FAD/FMN-containing dehydrogenase